MAERVAIALGSNVGDRAVMLAGARDAIGALPGTRVLAASTVEETAPLGPVPQGWYLNQMLVVETSMEPHELLASLLEIERAHGRVRQPGARWGPRTLDCDIVLFGDRRIESPDLVIPHPELPNRDFWQRELEELDADRL
jgi:2-amino-4-hydroxy-6-hydroxymethyldihydropteridine diphosphokinase